MELDSNIEFGFYKVISKNSDKVTLETASGKIKELTPEEYKKLTAKIAIVALEKKSKTMKFNYKNQVKTLYELATEHGLSPSTALQRIQSGQTIKQCLLNKTAKYLKSKNKFGKHINDGQGKALCRPNSSEEWIGTNTETGYICGSCQKKLKKSQTKT